VLDLQGPPRYRDHAVRSFRGDKAGRPLDFAFARARKMMRRMKDPPEIFLPGLDMEFPDTVEIGETKLPIAAMIGVLKKPRICVTGFWRVGSIRGMAQATIMRRTGGFWYEAAPPSPFGSEGML
jgi:hypothetical protein